MAARPLSILAIWFFLPMLGCAVLPACGKPAPLTDGKPLPLHIGGKPFDLELSLTPESRFKGLGGRPAPAAGTGMLFVYPMPRGGMSFVMRDCAEPMDILFLDSMGRMLRGYTMQPESPETPEEGLHHYRCPEAAQFVIELPAGSINQLQLTAGTTRVDLPAEELAAAAH